MCTSTSVCCLQQSENGGYALGIIARFAKLYDKGVRCGMTTVGVRRLSCGVTISMYDMRTCRVSTQKPRMNNAFNA